MGAMSFFLFIPSGGEFILVILAVLLLFGSDKIPDFARLVGKGMKEFRKATEDIKREINVETKDLREEIKKGEKVIRDEINNIKNPVEEMATDDPYAYGDEIPTDYYDSPDEETYEPDKASSEIKTEEPDTSTIQEDGNITQKSTKKSNEPDVQ